MKVNRRFGSWHGQTSMLVFYVAHLVIVSLLLAVGSSLDAAIVSTGNISPPCRGVVRPMAMWERPANGSLTIDAGSQLQSLTAIIAYMNGVTGTITVTDTGSKLTNSSSLYVGAAGNGMLNIEAGEVINYSGYLGYDSRFRGHSHHDHWNGLDVVQQQFAYVGLSGNGHADHQKQHTGQRYLWLPWL